MLGALEHVKVADKGNLAAKFTPWVVLTLDFRYSTGTNITRDGREADDKRHGRQHRLGQL